MQLRANLGTKKYMSAQMEPEFLPFGLLREFELEYIAVSGNLSSGNKLKVNAAFLGSGLKKPVFRVRNEPLEINELFLGSEGAVGPEAKEKGNAGAEDEGEFSIFFHINNGSLRTESKEFDK